MQHIRYCRYAMRILSDNSKTLLLCVTRKRTCYGDDRTSGACFLDEITMRNNLREWRRGEGFVVRDMRLCRDFFVPRTSFVVRYRRLGSQLPSL